ARCDITFNTVHANMSVADKLACRENRWREFGAVNDHIQTLLQQTDQIMAGVAFHARCFFISALELFFGYVAIIAFQLLLGAQLNTVVGKLAFAALTVLTGAIIAAIYR